MSDTTEFPAPVGGPYAPPPTPAPKPIRSKKHLIGYTATALVALGIGAASGSGGAATPTAAAPTVTSTVTVPGTPGDAVTVTAAAAAPAVKTVTVTVTPKPKATFPGDGTYQVGVDIKPGTYVSAPPESGNCYWARGNGKEGVDGIIANSNSSGQSVVTIKRTDKTFETTGCSEWRMR